jgi:hypothetical protein
MSTQFLSYPGIPWLTVYRDAIKFEIHVHIRFHHYTDTFTMNEDDIGEKGHLLLKEAYQRRAQLMVVYKIAKELEK